MPSGKLDIIVTSTPLDLFPRVAPSFKQNKHIYPPRVAWISEFTPLSLSLSLSLPLFLPRFYQHPPSDTTTLIVQITLLHEESVASSSMRTNRFRLPNVCSRFFIASVAFRLPALLLSELQGQLIF